VWPLSLIVAAWGLRTYYVPVLGASLSSEQAWLATALILAGTIFSLLAHYAAHIVAAWMLHTTPPASLPVYPSGDASQAWPAGTGPAEEAWTALAGPLGNLVLAGGGYLAWKAEPGTLINEIILFWVLFNVGLAGLNLAPAFPLDGGRLVRSLAWHLSRSANLGTRLSTRLGWTVCLLLLVWAAFLAAQRLRFSNETSVITLAVALLLAIELLAVRAPGRDDASPAPIERTGRLLRNGGVVLLVLLLGVGPTLLLPTNLGMEAPGPTASVEPMVHVPPEHDHPAKGTFILTTVVPQAPIVVAEWLYAQYDHAIRITPAKEIVSSNTSPQQVAIEGFHDLQQSEKTAIVVGLKLAGFEASLIDTGARIVTIQPDSKANGVLVLGDEIMAVDGQPVGQPADVSSILNSKPSATTAEIAVQRDGHAMTLSVGLMKNESGSPRIGINVAPTGDRIKLPFPVSITPQKVDGGPSAGLMFTLAVYNALTPVDLTSGQRVAGTGTIDLDGKVGAIGGVQQKVAAAERSGAKYFLVPADNYAEAMANASHIKVVKISTVQDALAFLQTLANQAPR
jgi:PDZ domain-containing protein